MNAVILRQYVPCSNGEKSILLNFCRKKILKIGKCREWYSEQLLLLELLIKIHSYSSGNRRNFGKMSGFEKKYVVLKLELIFQFRFYSCFFSIPITFTNFLENLSSHFFDFLSYMAGNCIFRSEIQPTFAKPKEILTKRSENPGHFTKNSSIS